MLNHSVHLPADTVLLICPHRENLKGDNPGWGVTYLEPVQDLVPLGPKPAQRHYN